MIADARTDDCPLIFVNPAFSVITGYDREEAGGFIGSAGPGTPHRNIEQCKKRLMKLGKSRGRDTGFSKYLWEACSFARKNFRTRLQADTGVSFHAGTGLPSFARSVNVSLSGITAMMILAMK